MSIVTDFVSHNVLYILVVVIALVVNINVITIFVTDSV